MLNNSIIFECVKKHIQTKTLISQPQKNNFMADPNPQNPTINLSGQASITSGQYCTWNTANGSNSTLTVSNSSRANNCVIAITGAPATGLIVQVNGVLVSGSIDNIYTIPPNTPSFTIIGTGNYGGSTVTITNITNAQNDAAAAIQAQTTAKS